MRFSARVLAVMVLFILAGMTALADDTAKPKDAAKKSEAGSASTSATATSEAATKPQPAASALLPRPRPAPASSSSSSMRGDNTPAVEAFLGYSYIRFTTDNRPIIPFPTVNIPDHFDLQGATEELTGNVTDWFGLVADFGQYNTWHRTPGVHAYTYLFGPQFSYRKSERVTPFAHALFGVASARGGQSLVGPTHRNAFADAIGVGLDVKVARNISWRLFQIDYLGTKFRDGHNNQQNNLRLSGGIVLRLGYPSAPLGASATCSVDKPEVWAGEPVKASVAPRNFDPKHTLKYAWATNGGKVQGQGATVTVDTAGVAEGQSYNVSVHVTDPKSKNAAATCQTTFATQKRLPPTISCSANPASVIVGGAVAIHCDAASPQGGPVSVASQSDCGVTGQGTDFTVDTAKLSPGSCAVQSTVTDDHQLTATTTTSFAVKAPPPPPPPPPKPQATAIELRLALHSIYFVTAQPTPANPTGGLVLSQQRTLIPVAADFKVYLESHPDAKLILEGHADPRGAPEYNQGLSERRVARTKAFLVEHGVPASSIETKAYGVQKNMTDAEVREAINSNPDLTPEERQRILRNERLIILASNRRVDIALSTTGQVSIRHFPFSAEDALTLIGGREKPKPAARPAPRRARPAPGKAPRKAAPKKQQ